MAIKLFSPKALQEWIESHKVVAAEWLYDEKAMGKGPYAMRLWAAESEEAVQVHRDLWKTCQSFITVGVAGKTNSMFQTKNMAVAQARRTIIESAVGPIMANVVQLVGV